MSDLPLIEPKTITLTSEVRKGVTKEFKIGAYPALEGARLLGLFAEAVDVAARKKSKEVSGLFGDNLKALAIEVCQYIEVKLSNGNWQKLDNEPLINAHIPDYEMLFKLVRETHDYNSFFFNSGRLLTTSQKLLSQAKQRATKIFQDLSGSFSVKNKQRSKS